MNEDRTPDRLFRPLRRRETPEIDSDRAWARLQARIEADPERAPGWGRWRLVVPVAAAAVLAMVLVWSPLGTAPPAAPAPQGSELVLLTPPETPMTDVAPGITAREWNLDVRLVRGFDGAPPADALPSTVRGAGGASLLADLRDQLAALLPSFDDFAVVGRWRGGLDAPLDRVALAEDYELEIGDLAGSPGEGVRLTGVRLQGAGRPGVAQEIVLQPGRVYLFGVQDTGEDRAIGSLVLALRVEPPASRDQD